MPLRLLAPGKKDSLPLLQTKFDPDGDDYDYESAKAD